MNPNRILRMSLLLVSLALATDPATANPFHRRTGRTAAKPKDAAAETGVPTSTRWALEPNSTIIDLGTIDDDYAGAFYVRNISKEPFKIQTVKVGCGSCTDVDYDRNATVPPGGKTRVKFTMKTKRMGAGWFSKPIYVILVPDRETIALRVRGTLEKTSSYTVRSRMIFLGDVLPDKQWERTVEITPPRSLVGKAKIQSLQCSNPQFVVDDVTRPEDQQITFRVRPQLGNADEPAKLPFGKFEEQVTVSVGPDPTDTRRLVFDLKGFVGYRLVPSQRTLNFQTGTDAETHTVRLNLTKGEKPQADKLAVTEAPEGAEVVFQEGEAGVTAAITFPPALRARPGRGKIVMTYPECQDLTLFYWVAPPRTRPAARAADGLPSRPPTPLPGQ